MKSEASTSENRLQLTRVFDAPRPVVFSWWSSAEKLQQWSGCKEAVSCEIQMDFRVGGGFTQKMNIGGKGDYSMTATYDEIVVPEKIAYRAQMGPFTTRVVVEFFEQGKRTKMVLTHDGFPDEFFRKTVSQGTTEGLDKLEAVLAGQATVNQ
jgi:uncharacterized protein YndB with AHSA1/START domain